MCARGPQFGYNPKAIKTVLVVKNEKRKEAKTIFHNTSIKIEESGCRHLGGALGKREFKEKYLQEKVKVLKAELETLSEFAKTQPQAAYACYTHGFKGKWTFLQRTVPHSAEIFTPLEEVLRTEFLPRVTGRDTISDDERKMLGFPTRQGGMGVKNPVETAQENFEASSRITSNKATRHQN